MKKSASFAKNKIQLPVLASLLLLVILIPVLVYAVKERTSLWGEAARGEPSFTCTVEEPCLGLIISDTIIPPTEPPGRPTPRPGMPTPRPWPSLPHTNYYLEKDSKLFLLRRVRGATVDFATYADTEREVAVVGDGYTRFEMNPGGNRDLVRRMRGTIFVESLSWAP